MAFPLEEDVMVRRGAAVRTYHIALQIRLDLGFADQNTAAGTLANPCASLVSQFWTSATSFLHCSSIFQLTTDPGIGNVVRCALPGGLSGRTSRSLARAFSTLRT